MTVLADHIVVQQRFSRSANLERDIDFVEPLDGYVVTSRALDVVRRVSRVANGSVAGGAWSITGPYGSGKSSLALLLDAAFGPAGPSRELALGQIDLASKHVGDSIRNAHELHRTSAKGFLRGLVTGNREPIAHTLSRALQSAIKRSTDKHRVSKRVLQAIQSVAQCEVGRNGQSVSTLVDVARCLASKSPLLLIVDEFGKNIEAIENGNEADPYLLQQVAEAGQGAGLPIFLFTLQHLSFESYVSDTNSFARNEWAKVHGRFEEIAFVESSRETRSLIGSVFKVESPTLQSRIDRWAETQKQSMRTLGITDLADEKTIASCYPLHPLSAMLLPELCNRYGQHERTLFSFLTSPHSASAASFLAATSLPSRGTLPSLGLDGVYDYFISGESTGSISTNGPLKLHEIALRLRDHHGLTSGEMKLAKSVAMLNVVSNGGTVRASSDLISHVGARSCETLSKLEELGVVTYRRFADEYRVWQGTDVDIQRLIDSARHGLKDRSLFHILSHLDQPQAQVAARHSAEHDVLRVFSKRFATSGEEVEPLDEFSPYDGQVLLLTEENAELPKLVKSKVVVKPTIAAIPCNVKSLEKISRDLVAMNLALSHGDVEADWVAKRELSERVAESKTLLQQTINSTYGVASCRWFLIERSGSIELSAYRGSAVLSEAADMAYPFTPCVGNEMLNRTDLTAQGARARKLLIEAMIERSLHENLGLEGYGPEVAMYRSFLSSTGLHRLGSNRKTFEFRAPRDARLLHAWDALAQLFKLAKTRRLNVEEAYSVLLLPPFGMKLGVIPVLLIAALHASRNEVALYEHGTFRPSLTPELAERMVANPAHFHIKHFANSNGARRKVLELLAGHLGASQSLGRHRVSNVLAIVGQLVSSLRNLDNYSLRTCSLSATTQKVREVISTAVEPDQLLFDLLPVALGFPPIPVDRPNYAFANEYAKCLAEAIAELDGCYDRLLEQLYRFVLDTCVETDRLSICRKAKSLDYEVLDTSIRALVGTLANDSVESNVDWARAIATVVAKKAPSEWSDEDVIRFRRQLPVEISAFERLVALYADFSSKCEQGIAFDALRVVVSRLDGSEHVTVVQIDDDHLGLIDGVLDRALEDLGSSIGSRRLAQRALLAVLGMRVLPEQTSDNGLSPSKRNSSNA